MNADGAERVARETRGKHDRLEAPVPMDLSDKVIIVTGGTSGMGEGCCQHFAELGAKVVAASIEREAGQALEAAVRVKGHDLAFVFTDVSNE